MLASYSVGGEKLDSLDLKVLLVTKGIRISCRVYEQFGKTHRIHPNPLACNCLILPDDTIVHVTDLALHMRYLQTAMFLEIIRNPRGVLSMQTPFRLDVSDRGTPVLLHKDREITEVRFPPASRFYEQKTSSGLSFLGHAVLQGLDFLSFQCLWPCDYAKSGSPCQFCYAGGIQERLTRKGKPDPITPSPQDVAEIIDFAVNTEKTARNIQLTGGSTMNMQAECNTIRTILEQANRVADLKNLLGEVLIYTTPPSDPEELDQLFDAGASRIACSLEVWNTDLAQTITPGKWKFSGRQRYLDCLQYIARKYGPNKACSSFVVGIEPAESFLEGANYLAAQGIVPIASIWIPFGRTVMGKNTAPGLDFYRKIKDGLANIYTKYDIIPPGSTGLNVCMCRDIWNHRLEINAT
jgi:hypothetical protein